MAVLVRPHVLLLRPGTEPIRESDKAALPMAFSDGAQVDCLCVGTGATAAVENLSDEVDSPMEVYLEIADSAGVQKGYQALLGTRTPGGIVWDSRIFTITSPVTVAAAGTPADHARFIIGVEQGEQEVSE